MIKVAIANASVPDGLTRTVIDGALELSAAGELEYRLAAPFDYPLATKSAVLARSAFTSYARAADLILFPYAKRGMQSELIAEIGAWHKTIFLDGSELGKNRRLDPAVQAALSDGSYQGAGRIDGEMLERCTLYFRRERPYPTGVLPLPFGIESRYRSYVRPVTNRDIDFFCVFGQETYPPLRREVRLALEIFCKERGLRAFTRKTWTQGGFYRALARSKVGISVSGGGFDSYRFWEILGSDCLLLTETVDIDMPPGTVLNYERVREFSDLPAFKNQLEKTATFLKERYATYDRRPEYEQILREHSTAARLRYVLAKAKAANLIAP